MEMDLQVPTSDARGMQDTEHSPEVPKVDGMVAATAAAAAASGSATGSSGSQGNPVSLSTTGSTISSAKSPSCAAMNEPHQTEDASSTDDEDASCPGTVNPPHSEASSPKLAPTMCMHHGGGRIRLPDKLMEYLDKEVLPDTLWWHPGGDCFVFDAEKIQATFLNKYFRGTKLKSFIRSLNRWQAAVCCTLSCLSCSFVFC